ncbi:hypothetical protein [Neolewinella agarilytica]|uniref:TIGR02588 family protein n=1 Tax=Neolewinella agarilytica TaxID=478744 RepID=A0A1H9EEK1_9BACT|nr:hypothetical protein [Neolewinella agarilytica]SEQ24101.1 TIGR02588 family protein [Neolewinella agarilytica]
MKDDQKNSAKDSSTEQQPPPTIIAWSVRGVSLLLILSLIGFFIWSALQPRIEPAFDLAILDDKIERRGEEWVLPVEVTNRGSISVHKLKVKASLSNKAKGAAEEAHIVPMLGPNEMVTLVFWFDQDPRQSQPQLSVGSYQLP